MLSVRCWLALLPLSVELAVAGTLPFSPTSASLPRGRSVTVHISNIASSVWFVLTSCSFSYSHIAVCTTLIKPFRCLLFRVSSRKEQPLGQLRPSRKLSYITYNLKQVIAGSRACRLNSLKFYPPTRSMAVAQSGKNSDKIFLEPDIDPDHHRNLMVSSVANVPPFHRILWKKWLSNFFAYGMV